MSCRKCRAAFFPEESVNFGFCEDCFDEYLDIADLGFKILAEGSFAQVKQDMNFRRFMCRGQRNVLAESVLLAMAVNINKLHNKIQKDRTGKHLFELKKSA